MKSQTILVTGGAGFIGSSLIDKLIEHKTKIICLDNFDNFYPKTIKLNNIRQSNNSQLFKFLEGDIRDASFVNKVFAENNPDMVVHLAAKAGVRPSILDPVTYYDVNLTGSLNILEMMKKYKVEKLIFSSSSSVYGNNEKIPYSESDNVDYPISPYAASKKAGELLTHTYHHLYNIDVINLRFFTVYGPRQRPDLAIHKFFKNLYNNTSIDIYGDGNTSRDYTYIDDITQGIFNAITYLEKNNNVYEIINLGNSSPVKLSELIYHIEQITNKKFLINYLPMQEGDVNNTFADIKKAIHLIQYSPAYTIREGLCKFKDWYEAHNF